MTGKQLKDIIERSGIRTNAFAELMGMTPQSLNQIFHAIDVKSGIIEKVSLILRTPISTIYGETPQTVSSQIGIINNGGGVGDETDLPPNMYETLKRKDEQISQLLDIIQQLNAK